MSTIENSYVAYKNRLSYQQWQEEQNPSGRWVINRELDDARHNEALEVALGSNAVSAYRQVDDVFDDECRTYKFKRKLFDVLDEAYPVLANDGVDLQEFVSAVRDIVHTQERLTVAAIWRQVVDNRLAGNSRLVSRNIETLLRERGWMPS